MCVDYWHTFPAVNCQLSHNLFPSFIRTALYLNDRLIKPQYLLSRLLIGTSVYMHTHSICLIYIPTLYRARGMYIGCIIWPPFKREGGLQHVNCESYLSIVYCIIILLLLYDLNSHKVLGACTEKNTH